MYSHYLIQEIVKQADCWLLHFYVGDSARNEEMCAILFKCIYFAQAAIEVTRAAPMHHPEKSTSEVLCASELTRTAQDMGRQIM